MGTNDDQSSQPAAPIRQATETLTTQQHSGLTKRETAAIAAMQGLLAHGGTAADPLRISKCATEHADALFAELGKDGAK